MSCQMALCYRVLKTRDITPVLDFGITADDFIGHEGKALWQTIIGYYNHPHSSGSIIDPHLLRYQAKGFAIGDDMPGETTHSLCVEVRKERIRAEGNQAVVEFTQGLYSNGIDPMAPLATLHSHVTRLQALGTTANTDMSMLQGAKGIRQKIALAKLGVDSSKMMWPWQPLQDETFGLQPDDYIVFYGRPKCVPLDEPVLTAQGDFQTIEDVRSVVALNHKTQKLLPGKVTGRTDVVMKEVFRIETTSGYRTRVGSTHPLLRPDMSYAEARTLQVGDFVGVAGRLPDMQPEEVPLTTREAELHGLLIVDGNTTRNEIQFTSKDPDVQSRVADLVHDFRCRLTNGSRPIEFRVVGEARGDNALLRWLRSEGAWGRKSIHKSVPARLFRAPKLSIVAFLGGLLATYGGVTPHEVRWNTSSETLAREVKHLLLRLGVVGKLQSVPQRNAFVVIVSAQEQHARLLPMLPYVATAYKAEALRALVDRPLRRKRHNDGIPYSDVLSQAVHSSRPPASNGAPGGGWPGLWNGFSTSKLFRRTGVISRHLLRVLSEALNAKDLLVWADSDVRWERITSIVSEGVLPCADISVKEHHNFLIGDFITHNSMKTWLITYLIAWAFMNEKRVLVYTKEMTQDNVYMRMLACVLKFQYRSLRGAVMSQYRPMSLGDEQKLDDLIAYIDSDPNLASLVTVLGGRDVGAGMDTVPWLRSKIKQYAPEVAFVDGLYLMSDHRKNNSDQQRVMNISRDMRDTVLATKTPIIATMQANRKAAAHKEANLDEIAYSDALAQDATIAARVINDKNSPTMSVVIGGSREFELHGFRIHAIPATNFDFHSILTEQDIKDATEHDRGEEEAKAENKKKAKSKKGEAAKDTSDQDLEFQLQELS